MGYDVTDVLKLMDDYAQSTGKSLSDMFSSSEGAKAASILLSNMEGFKNNITSMIDSTDAAATAAETMMDTTAEKVQVAKTQIDNLTSAIAEQMLPIIGEASQEVSEAINTADVKEIADTVGSFISGTLTLLLKNIKLITSAVTGVTAAFIAFKTAAMITKVIQSWQTAALQVKLLSSAQSVAAVKTAALNGQLTVQETIYALLSGKLDMATVKQMALNTAMSMNPAGLIAAAVGLLATVLTGFALNAASATDEIDDLNSSAEALNQAAHDLNQTAMESDQAAQEVKKLIDEYRNIKSASDNTEEAKKRLKEIQDTLVSTYDVEAEKLDLVNGKYEDQLSILQKVADKKNETARMAANAAYFNSRDIIQSGYSIDISDSEIDLSDKIGREIFERMLSDNKIPAKISEDGKKLIFDAGTTYEEAEKYLVSWGKTLETGISIGGKSGLYSWISNAALEAQAANEEYQKIVELYKQYNDFDTLGSGNKTSGTGTDSKKSGDILDIESQKKTYKTIRDELKKEYELGEIDAATYYSKLESLRDKYLSYAVESDEWHDATLEIKKYRDQLTEEQKKAYEQQVAAQKKAAEEAATARKQAYTEEKSQLEFKLKTNQISEKKYYTELSKLRDKYLDKNSSEWRSAYLETYEYNQKIIQANKDALEKLLSDTSDSTLTALEKITSARDSLTAKLTDFNKTFEKVTETIPETIAVKGEFTITTAEHEEDVYKMGADSIDDNIKVLEDYGAMLDALKARGADESTLSSILDIDIEEGMKYGTELLKMSDQAWGSYFDSLDRLHKTAADISAKYYQSQVDDLRENFIDKMRKELDGLGTDMYKVGADVAAEFVKGWNEAMGTKDLTVGELMRSVSGGTMSTAPTAAKALSATSGTNSSAAGKAASQIVKIPVYIGTQKLADIIADVTNGKIIQTGKNILLT